MAHDQPKPALTPPTSSSPSSSPPSNGSGRALTTHAAPNLPAPYKPAAAGFGAVTSSFKYALQTSGVGRGAHVFLHVNQKDGFDCPGCAWPDPEHRSVVEFCENGARAVAHEADKRKVDAAFFAAHTVDELRAQSDHWLEHQGRLVQPMILRAGAKNYVPLSYADAFAIVADELHALSSPDEAAFYTSGRTSNDAAFLYQLFARAFGTNNLPDCSNMCHESSGKGLSTTIGIGKGTVQLADFALADLVFVIGQNPGTNHPRMLTTLQECARRGCEIISINPLRERALEVFAHPQNPAEMLKSIIGQGTSISSQYLQVKINGDVALLKGIMKVVVERGALDRAFLAEHCIDADALLESIREASWDEIVQSSGIARADIERAAWSYMRAERVIVCWAMGLTQHKNAVGNIREIVNLLALRGMLGKPGAGVCPVRGHSNVQGDRTVGIYEAPSESFLARLDAATGIVSPRKHGFDVVAAIRAMEAGIVKVFVGMGGNFVAATPDTARTAAALAKCALTVHVSTKLNRSHLEHGKTAIILPCLGRSEIDVRGGKLQFVTVENSMGVVHKSEGKLAPASSTLLSEPAIVAGIARATFGQRGEGGGAAIAWEDLTDDYDRIRDLIEKSIAGFDAYNERVRRPDGFLLPNGVRERKWHTASGKVELTVQPIPPPIARAGQLVMMTIRTHDQFNTTIYDVNDRYRGVYGERRVVFAHPDDIAAFGFRAGELVDVTSHYKGEQRVVHGFKLVAYDIPRGCCAAYFPETNPLVPLESQADESGTPTSKSFAVTFARASS